ncbi:hypothetical protein R84981_002892 [Carnimonas sp. R-84981]|uniref:hypothetical protein n=1 Tax=Carnimonas bestiolae TaxID=3402172 RepID=UPI003EDBE839
MALNRIGHVNGALRSRVPGGLRVITPGDGGYTGPGGTWEDGEDSVVEVTYYNVQPSNWKDIQFLIGMGGTANPHDSRVVHINDGVTYLQPDDTGKFAQLLQFSDGIKQQKWRVMSCDNRPWRNFCRVIVERYRGAD